jgi:shikimate dehydrogenase
VHTSIGEIDAGGIQPRKVPTFFFVGVSTQGSSIMKVFPRWMDALGKSTTEIVGVDHALHDAPETYQRTVAQIKFDPLSLGALVTSHKISILEATRDMFDRLDQTSVLAGEVSCIYKRNGQLIGHALDPLTGGMSLDAILGKRYFERTGAHLLCFGAGGAGKAIGLHLINKEQPGDRPERIHIVNRSRPRLIKYQEMVGTLATDIQFEYIQNEDPMRNDAIMATLPEGSIVINASGLGKDLPGSPITDQGFFPREGIAWELNYRGSLEFWHQAKAQERTRNLTIEDGWLYFLHGWTQHIAMVLNLEMNELVFNNLAEIARDLRPPLKFHGDKT